MSLDTNATNQTITSPPLDDSACPARNTQSVQVAELVDHGFAVETAADEFGSSRIDGRKKKPTLRN
jgi:hypothetical protein